MAGMRGRPSSRRPGCGPWPTAARTCCPRPPRGSWGAAGRGGGGGGGRARRGPGPAVAPAVLSALGRGEPPPRPALDQLADHFGAGRALVVTDNCEHLLDSVAGLVEPLLGRSPGVTVLA